VHDDTVRLYQSSLSFVLVYQANPKKPEKKIPEALVFISFSFYPQREKRGYLTHYKLIKRSFNNYYLSKGEK